MVFEVEKVKKCCNFGVGVINYVVWLVSNFVFYEDVNDLIYELFERL